MSQQIQIAPELNETQMLGHTFHRMCPSSLSIRGILFSICNFTKDWEEVTGAEMYCTRCIEVEESKICLVCGKDCFND